MTFYQLVTSFALFMYNYSLWDHLSVSINLSLCEFAHQIVFLPIRIHIYKCLLRIYTSTAVSLSYNEI
jgi:hypothetical protein